VGDCKGVGLQREGRQLFAVYPQGFSVLALRFETLLIFSDSIFLIGENGWASQEEITREVGNRAGDGCVFNTGWPI